MRASPVLLLALLALTLGGFGVSCLKLSWREGIACEGTRCPGALECCAGKCLQKCLAVEDAGADVAVGDVAETDGEPTAADARDDGPTDGPMVVVCPAEVGGCFSCMPGCACSCGAVSAICCLKLGFATCSGCP